MRVCISMKSVLVVMLMCFSGNMLQGYSVRIGSSDGVPEQDFPFTLRTPERTYNLSSLSESDRDEWILQLSNVIAEPLGKRDYSCKFDIYSKQLQIYYILIYFF